MNCPTCKKPTRVLETRLVDSGQRQRRRVCPRKHAIFTLEVVVNDWKYVDPRVKNPGTMPRKNPREAKPIKVKVTKASLGWLKRIESFLANGGEVK